MSGQILCLFIMHVSILRPKTTYLTAYNMIVSTGCYLLGFTPSQYQLVAICWVLQPYNINWLLSAGFYNHTISTGWCLLGFTPLQAGCLLGFTTIQYQLVDAYWVLHLYKVAACWVLHPHNTNWLLPAGFYTLTIPTGCCLTGFTPSQYQLVAACWVLHPHNTNWLLPAGF